jgi:hypothetical protein
MNIIEIADAMSRSIDGLQARLLEAYQADGKTDTHMIADLEHHELLALRSFYHLIAPYVVGTQTPMEAR